MCWEDARCSQNSEETPQIPALGCAICSRERLNHLSSVRVRDLERMMPNGDLRSYPPE